MKESGAFFASIAAGVVLAVLVGAAFTLSYPGTKSVPTTTEASQTTTKQLTGAVPSTTTTLSTTLMPTTATVTESTTMASSTTTVTSSATLPCSAPGVQCGSFQILSATLVALPGADGFSNLTITLMNTGNVEIGSFEVFLNYVVNGSSLLGGLPPGQQTTISIEIQNAQFQVMPGQAYTVLVEGFLINDNHITANLSGSEEVIASSGSTKTTTTLYGSTLTCSDNCTINPPWPVYQTLHDLKDASPFVVVANVTSASVTDVDGIPVTVYQLSVVTNIEGPGPNRTAGMTTLPMA